MLNLNVQGEIDRLEQTYLSNCRQVALMFSGTYKHIVWTFSESLIPPSAKRER